MTGLVASVLVELFAIANMSNISFCDATFYMGCLKSERVALLKLKQNFRDPSNHLASWIGDRDCCEWGCVVCNNMIGHVFELNLESSEFGGKINLALVDSKHLNLLLIGWQPPPWPWCKLNTDGSCRNSWDAGAGGVIRDFVGHWISGFCMNIGECTVIMAEL
ncbi:hypothetical protein AB3S75_017619 [Citrus x aurantiifolia]